MSEQEEKITLTLAAEAEEAKPEEAVEQTVVEVEKPIASVAVSDVVGHAELNDSGLSEEEKKMVEDFAKQIDITKTNSILQYGAAAQNKVAEFSENTLKNVKAKKFHTADPYSPSQMNRTNC